MRSHNILLLAPLSLVGLTNLRAARQGGVGLKVPKIRFALFHFSQSGPYNQTLMKIGFIPRVAVVAHWPLGLYKIGFARQSN